MNFNQWVTFCFNRPIESPVWHWSEEYDDFEDFPDDLSIEFLTKLFSSPLETLSSFSDAQVNQGFWYLICTMSSPCIYALFSDDIKWENKKDCINSISTLYSEYFATKCSKALSHNDPEQAKISPINSICYMFWDLIPWQSQTSNNQVYLAYLDVIEEIMNIDHPACQESALHGLGHCYVDHPDRVTKVIDNFLIKNTDINNDLKEYALNAKTGNIQ